MTNKLDDQVSRYQKWRDELRGCIEAYQTWLETHGHTDIQHSLKIYDLIERLRNDRLVLAFLAEYSRGKSELINAMFFADYKQRLLPSDVGRTTMCPTEIFHDAAEEPYLMLLPIETRRSEVSIASLKQTPVDWVKIRLVLNSPEEMIKAMSSLAQVKSVTLEEAEALGLLDETDFAATTVVVKQENRIEIPCWRHAMINYPHPLLQKGLAILDTPGLNALGTEPELTLSMIPNAHAVLFLLAMDTGVTKSDLEVWQKYVQNYVMRRIAVLNKIDVAWDELKSDDQVREGIDRQLEETAKILSLPRDHVVALSAKVALIARIKGDAELLTKSRIGELENLLAAEIIPAKQQILRESVSREIGDMVEVSLHGIMRQLQDTQNELLDMYKLSGKNRNLAKAMVSKVEQDRMKYYRQMETYRTSCDRVARQGKSLLESLSDDRLDTLLKYNRKVVEGSWTTAGLMNSMRSLFDAFSVQADKFLEFTNETRVFVDRVYNEFHTNYGFAKNTPPALNLERHVLAMRALQQNTEKFCKDPANILGREKHFVVRRFYGSLANRGRELFDKLRKDLETWLGAALSPLSLQLQEHQKLLERRVENARKVAGDVGTLQERMRQLDEQILQFNSQLEELNRIRGVLYRDDPTVQIAKAA
jgi:Dynamin family